MLGHFVCFARKSPESPHGVTKMRERAAQDATTTNELASRIIFDAQDLIQPERIGFGDEIGADAMEVLDHDAVCE